MISGELTVKLSSLHSTEFSMSKSLNVRTTWWRGSTVMCQIQSVRGG